MISRFFVSVVFLMTIVGAVFAQSNNGEIVGTIHDPQGRVVPEATVMVTNTATGLNRSATTPDNGSFRFPALPAGIYTLSAQKSGFATAIINRVEVQVDEIVTADVALTLARSAQTVTVESSVTLTDTETPHLGGVIQQSQVTTLPLNGRDFAQLALLNAGVSAFGGGGGQQGGEGGSSGYSSNGQRSTSNNFMVDGIDNNDYEGGGVAQLPSIDSIQEFQVQTNNYSAEYGRSSGSIVNLVTKSGTNNFHGSAYEFFRNDALDARNFFANPNLPAPELRLNQFGATLGGPIQKDKTFFFGNYEGFRQIAGLTNVTNVPTDAEKAGTFNINPLDPSSPTVQVPVNPISAELFKLYPEPNTSQPGGNYVSSPNLTNSTDQYMIKLDHQLEHGTLTARYSLTDATIFFPFQPGQGTTAVPGYGVDEKNTDHLGSLGYTWIISPSMLNEFRFGFTRLTGYTYNQTGPQAVTYGFNTGYPAGAPTGLGDIPNITFSGGLVSSVEPYSNLGASGNNPAGNWINTLEWVDNFSRITPRHEWKFGGEVRNIRDNRLYDLYFNGQLAFTGSNNPQGIPNPLVDFAEGLPTSSLQFVGNSGRSYRTTSFDFFAQDKFKIRPNLTFSYGLRYELNTVLHDATGRSSTWRSSLYTTYLPPSASQTDLADLQASGIATQAQLGGLYNGDHNNFAPRLGLAYSIGSAQETVIRAGYGIFYDTVFGNIPGNVMLNPPFLPDYYDSNPPYPGSFGPSGFPVLTVTAPNMPTPYSQAWNLDIQHQLSSDMLLDVAYVGTTGTHLPRFVQIDQAYITQAQIATLTPDVVTRLEILGLPPSVATFLSQNIAAMPTIVRGPYFGFAQIFQAQDSMSSYYNGLQAKLDKHLRNGLSFGVAYTYSKSIDSASDFFGSGANGSTIFPQNNYDTAAEKGLSDFDIRHRFVFNYIYTFPSLKNLWAGIPDKLGSGWEISGILTAQTGQPFSVLTGADESSTGLGDDRANVTGNPNAGPHTVAEFFNTAAFSLNAPLTFGDSGRNIVEGPGFTDLDFALMKNIVFEHGLTLQFRSEFFNILNHPAFALPDHVLTSPGFGALFQTADVAQNNVGLGSGGPRLIQFALKVMF
jgi:Carboxypeptidase regulatory-like domain/TonB-dependent Receptor Plug Domain